jgi:hypothetical protein
MPTRKYNITLDPPRKNLFLCLLVVTEYTSQGPGENTGSDHTYIYIYVSGRGKYYVPEGPRAKLNTAWPYYCKRAYVKDQSNIYTYMILYSEKRPQTDSVSHSDLYIIWPTSPRIIILIRSTYIIIVLLCGINF